MLKSEGYVMISNKSFVVGLDAVSRLVSGNPGSTLAPFGESYYITE